MSRVASGRRCWARVVEVPDDRFTVHLVVEVGRAGGDPEYRAPTTVCGLLGYRATERSVNACRECERALPDAIPGARHAAVAREAAPWRS